MKHVSCPWHTVVGQLHNKRHRLSLKGCFLENQSHNNSHNNSKQIKPNHHQCSMLREKCRCKKCINGKLRRTAHEGRQKNGHFSVPLRGKSPACHNSRHSTAKSNQHWHNTSSGKSQLSQKLIHNKGNAGHISAVFQKRQEEEQGYNNRQEAQYAANAVKYAVDHQRMNHFIHLRRLHGLIHRICQCCDTRLQNALEKCSNHIKGQPKYQTHNSNKRRNSRIFSRKELVNPSASGSLPAFSWLDHSLTAHIFNIIKPHLSHCCRPIHASFFLCLPGNFLQNHGFLICQL